MTNSIAPLLIYRIQEKLKKSGHNIDYEPLASALYNSQPDTLPEVQWAE